MDKVTSIYSKDGDDYTHMKVTTANADPAEKYYVKKDISLQNRLLLSGKTKTAERTRLSGITGRGKRLGIANDT